jgi:hypothetical protein
VLRFPTKSKLIHYSVYNELTANTIFRRCRRIYHIYIYITRLRSTHLTSTSLLYSNIYIALWLVFIINVPGGYTYTHTHYRRKYHIYIIEVPDSVSQKFCFSPRLGVMQYSRNKRQSIDGGDGIVVS